MEIKNIIKESESIKRLIKDQHLFEAITKIEALSKIANKWYVYDKLKRLQETYKYMLHYWSEGVEDSNRKNLLFDLKEDLYRLNDSIEFELRLADDYSIYFEQRRIFDTTNKNLSTTLSDYYSTLREYSVMIESNQYDKSLAEKMENITTDIFNYLWLTPFISTEDDLSIRELLNDNTINKNHKSFISSALLLGELAYYDKKKLLILLDNYINRQCLHSLVSIVLIMTMYEDRINSDDAISQRVDLMSQSDKFIGDLKNVVLSLIKTKDTERINKKMRDEVIPEIMKLQPQIINRFKDTDRELDIYSMEGNPEWQDMLEKSGISDKLKELSEMQSDGADVMMIAFSNLKNFDFFSKVSNWLLPFDINNSHLEELQHVNNNNLMTIINNDAMMCDSDRYSFALSICKMPEQQRTIIIQQMDAQISQFNEEKQTSLQLSYQNNESHTITKYVRDIYRFFKLYPRRKNFNDPFSINFDITKLSFLSKYLQNNQLIELIAEFYFSRKYYEDALRLFLILEKKVTDASLYQKIAYCYQAEKNIYLALKYYKKAEILLSDNLWLIKKIAICNKNLGQYAEAIKYYRKALEYDSENLKLVMTLGHCLLENNEIDEALQCYYKVEYLDENSSKAIRPIAWCEFLSKHYDKSHQYYTRILNDNPTESDYLNIGHLFLVEGNIKEAINYYKQCVISMNNNFDEFTKIFSADISQLTKMGINIEDIPFIRDKVLLDLRMDY